MSTEQVKNCVQKLRKNFGMTQQELAESLNITRQTIIAIEKGNYVPSVLLALKIAKVFNKPLEKIFKIAYEK